MKNTADNCRGLVPLLALALALAVPGGVLAKPPDLTAAGVIATIDCTYTYNLV